MHRSRFLLLRLTIGFPLVGGDDFLLCRKTVFRLTQKRFPEILFLFHRFGIAALRAAFAIRARKRPFHGEHLPVVHRLWLCLAGLLSVAQKRHNLRIRGIVSHAAANERTPLVGAGFVAHKRADLPFAESRQFHTRPAR